MRLDVVCNLNLLIHFAAINCGCGQVAACSGTWRLYLLNEPGRFHRSYTVATPVFRIVERGIPPAGSKGHLK